MPTPPSQPAARRLLPRPAALRVLDDAGKPHRHDVPRIWLPWMIRERDPTSRAIRRQQMMTGWDQSTGMVMGVVVAAYIILSRKMGLPDYLMFAGAVAIGGPLGWMMWWNAHRRIETHWDSLGHQWTEAGLTRGRCPACLYSLAGAEPDNAGLSRCAECGAAWRHDRIGQQSDREQPLWRRLLTSAIAADTRRSVRDDDGRAFSAERLSAIAARTGESDPETTETVRRLRASGAPARILAAVAAGSLALLPVLMLARVAARASIAMPPWVLLTLPMMLIPAAILGVFIICSEFGLTARSRRRHMLAAGLCPVCAGRNFLPDTSDPSLATCAGCTAAWRTNQHADPMAPDPSAPSDPSTHAPTIPHARAR